MSALLLIAGMTFSDMTRSVTCASAAPAGYNECKVGGRITGARMVDEYSLVTGTCKTGLTWGWYADRVWTRSGCNARFEVQIVPDPQYPAVISCASPGGADRVVCPAGFAIGYAELQRQTSFLPCIDGQSFGVDNNVIWVSGGCAGTFLAYPRSEY